MRSSKRLRRDPMRFTPRVVRLEDRTVPAGNVMAFVYSGTLFVVGDNAANMIWVGALGDESAGIVPIDTTTTVNGSTTPQKFDGISGGYVIMLGGGDDVLALTGQVPGFLYTD